MPEGTNIATGYVKFVADYAEAVRQTKELQKEAERAFDSIVDAVEDAEQSIESFGETVEEASDSASDAAENVSSSFQGIGGTISAVASTVATAFAGIVGAVRAVIDILQGMGQVATSVFSLMTSLVGTLISVLQGLATAGGKAFDVLISVAETYRDMLIELGKQIGELIKQFATLASTAREHLEELTKIFVFIQLDIRHVLVMMRRLAIVTTGAIGAATAELTRFEEQFVKVRRVLDATTQDLDYLALQIRELSTDIVSTAAELSDLASVAGRLGIDAVDEVEEFSEVMSRLQMTTAIAGEEGATQFARLIRLTDASMNEMEELASVIVQLGRNFALFEDELLTMAMRVAGPANAIGIAADEVLALGAAMGEAGIRAELGGSAMSRIILQIQESVNEGAEALETFADVMGVTPERFEQIVEENPVEAIEGFITGLREMNEAGEDINAVLEEVELNQIRVRDVILRLMGAGDLLNETLATASDEWREANALAEESATRHQTLWAQIQMLRDEVLEAGRALARPFVERMREMVGLARVATRVFRDLTPEQKEVITGFVSLAATLTTVVASILTATRAIFTILTGLTLLGRFALWLAPFVGAIWLLREALDAVGIEFEGFGSIILWITDIVSSSVRAMLGAIEQLTETDLWEDAVEVAEEAVEEIREITEEDLPIEVQAVQIMEVSVDALTEWVRLIREQVQDAIDYFEEEQEIDDEMAEDSFSRALINLAESIGDLLAESMALAFWDLPRLGVAWFKQTEFYQEAEETGEEFWERFTDEWIPVWADTISGAADTIEQFAHDVDFADDFEDEWFEDWIEDSLEDTPLEDMVPLVMAFAELAEAILILMREVAVEIGAVMYDAVDWKEIGTDIGSAIVGAITDAITERWTDYWDFPETEEDFIEEMGEEEYEEYMEQVREDHPILMGLRDLPRVMREMDELLEFGIDTDEYDVSHWEETFQEIFSDMKEAWDSLKRDEDEPTPHEFLRDAWDFEFPEIERPDWMKWETPEWLEEIQDLINSLIESLTEDWVDIEVPDWMQTLGDVLDSLRESYERFTSAFGRGDSDIVDDERTTTDLSHLFEIPQDPDRLTQDFLDEFFEQEDVERQMGDMELAEIVLAQLGEAEAAVLDEEGLSAAVETIITRALLEDYPDTVWEVIPQAGQFEPVTDYDWSTERWEVDPVDYLFRQPDEETLSVVRELMEGGFPHGGLTHFANQALLVARIINDDVYGGVKDTSEILSEYDIQEIFSIRDLKEAEDRVDEIDDIMQKYRDRGWGVHLDVLEHPDRLAVPGEGWAEHIYAPLGEIDEELEPIEEPIEPERSPVMDFLENLTMGTTAATESMERLHEVETEPAWFDWTLPGWIEYLVENVDNLRGVVNFFRRLRGQPTLDELVPDELEDFEETEEEPTEEPDEEEEPEMTLEQDEEYLEEYERYYASMTEEGIESLRQLAEEYDTTVEEIVEANEQLQEAFRVDPDEYPTPGHVMQEYGFWDEEFGEEILRFFDAPEFLREQDDAIEIPFRIIFEYEYGEELGILEGIEGVDIPEHSEGTTRVPGTGRGDKIPAMLEPGEAVVPRDVVASGMNAIQGWFASNATGYQEGTTGAFRQFFGGQTGDELLDTLDRSEDMLNTITEELDGIQDAIVNAMEASTQYLVQGLETLIDIAVWMAQLFTAEELDEEIKDYGETLKDGLGEILKIGEDIFGEIERDEEEEEEPIEPDEEEPTELEPELMTPHLDMINAFIGDYLDALGQGFDMLLAFDYEAIGMALGETVISTLEPFVSVIQRTIEEPMQSLIRFGDALAGSVIALGELSAGLMTESQEISNVMSTFRESLAEDAEDLDPEDSLMALLDAGDPIRALINVIVDLLTETEAFQNFLEMVSQTFEMLFEQLNPIVESIVPILETQLQVLAKSLQLLFGILQPVIDILSSILLPIIEALGSVIERTVELIVDIWNALINVLDSIIFWEDLEDWKIELRDATEQTEEFSEALEEAVRNIPSGFRVGRAVWGAEGELLAEQNPFDVNVREIDTQQARDMMGRSQPRQIHIHFEDEVYGMDDFENTVKDITKRAEERETINESGSKVEKQSKYDR